MDDDGRMGQPNGIHPTLWLLLLLTVPAVVISTQLYFGYRSQGIQIPFGPLLIMQLAHWYLWAVFERVVWRLAHRWPLDGSRGAIVRHVIAAPVVAIAFLASFTAVFQVLVRVEPLSSSMFVQDRSLSRFVPFIITAYFHVELLVYGVILAAAHLARARSLLKDNQLHALQLRTELSDAKLQVLRAQLQPHFLFNTLHTIGSLVMQREHDAALKTLAQLGELLRMTLEHRDAPAIPFSQELSYLRSYVGIEETRFGTRVDVTWSIDPDTLDLHVPTFILQPVVENAFRHGVANRTGPSAIRIQSALTDGLLQIDVSNDGPPLAATFSVEKDGGFGLRNVAQRLATWDPRSGLAARGSDNGAFMRLTLPVRRDEHRG